MTYSIGLNINEHFNTGMVAFYQETSSQFLEDQALH